MALASDDKKALFFKLAYEAGPEALQASKEILSSERDNLKVIQTFVTNQLTEFHTHKDWDKFNHTVADEIMKYLSITQLSSFRDGMKYQAKVDEKQIHDLLGQQKEQNSTEEQ